jgi:hypothetical protein|nr:MAG TPA: hypothetical protein [Caudoviricetes sp.]
MGVKAKFNNKEYELIYNSQSGFYEIEIEAPEVGGVYNAEVVFEDLLGNIEESNKKIQIWSKEKKANVQKETLVYFLDKSDLEIKDYIEFEDYEYVIDEETNQNTIFNVMKKVNAENGDIVILQRDGKTDYIGKIQDIENEDGELRRKITLKYISNIFDRKIIVENEKIISSVGIEDFIAKEIYDNFTNSEDNLLNIKWLDVEIKTHTKITKSINAENGIYNFHTFVTNCTQNYNIVLEFVYENQRIKLKIYKQDSNVQLIDTTIADISNYVEKFETNIIAKVVVKTNTDIQKWYLLSDRTTTQNKDDKNRAVGEIETLYTQKSEDAKQTALDKFKSNTYNHYISFKIYRYSKLFDVEKLKIGTPLSVRTNNNIILNTYISAIEDKGDNFINITCGNMRIKFIDKILKERKE